MVESKQFTAAQLLVPIVTVVYNDAKGLDKTIQGIMK